MVGQRLELAVELELPRGVERLEPFAKLGAEHRAERPHREQVIGARADPAAALQRRAAAGDDAVQVVMVQQGLAPGVQHGRDAQLRAQVVAAEAQQRFGGRGKEQVVEQRPGSAG